jgi:hypothetical protein
VGAPTRSVRRLLSNAFTRKALPPTPTAPETINDRSNESPVRYAG